MLTAAELLEALAGLDPDAQVVVGIINEGTYNAAYAQQEVHARAVLVEPPSPPPEPEMPEEGAPEVVEIAIPDEMKTPHFETWEIRPDQPALALYICCYEKPRPPEKPHQAGDAGAKPEGSN